MDANPDNRDACGQKLWYLYPRWHGTHAQMVAFGRERLATQNWWGPLPTILVDAHEGVSKEMSDPEAYLALPQVWGDIEQVYRSFLDVFPDSPKASWYRNRLAKWACDCDQWDAARKLFAEIGDKPDLTVFHSAAVYRYYRKKAQKKSTGAEQAYAAPAVG